MTRRCSAAGSGSGMSHHAPSPPPTQARAASPPTGRAMPWAGMRGPLGQFAVPRAMPCLVCVAPLGQMEQWHFDPASMPKRASRSDVSARLRWSQSRHHVFVPMPQRGIAYQLRVPTLGIHQANLTRVLKERRLSARVPETDPGPPYAVFLENTPILSDAVPRVGTLGWYALPRWGNLQFPGRCPAWYALPPSGQFAVPRAMPCLVCVAPLGQIER